MAVFEAPAEPMDDWHGEAAKAGRMRPAEDRARAVSSQQYQVLAAVALT